MWEKLRIVFTIPELRQKILLTLVLLAVYRVGYHVRLPMVPTRRPRIVSSADSWIRSPCLQRPTSARLRSSVGDHAVYLGFDRFPIAWQRVEAD